MQLQRGVWIALFLLSLGMHWQHLRKDLISIHVWRQTQTQATVRAFYEEDMHILHPRRDERGDGDGLFLMEFPLMQWTVAAIWHLTGPQLWVSRMFMFLCYCLAALALSKLIRLLTGSEWAALAAGWGLLFSPAFYYHGINPMPDNLALCLSLWGLAWFVQAIQERSRPLLLLGGCALALGVACKLPFIVWYAAPAWYFMQRLWNKDRVPSAWAEGILFVLPFLIPAAWYAWVIPQWQADVITQGIIGNWESLQNTFGYIGHNLVSTLPELLMGWALLPLFLAGIYFFFRRKYYRHLKFPLLAVWFLALVAFYMYETNAIRDDHDYYFYPFYPFVFFPIALAVKELAGMSGMWRNVVISMILLAPLNTHLRMHQRWNPENPGFNADVLRHKPALQKAVPADALVVAGNDVSHFIWLYHLDKKGWCFEKDGLAADSLRSWRTRGAAYLYSDSRKLERRPDIAVQFDRLVDTFGTVHLYALKPSSAAQVLR
ncbi:MAG: glycosyltransferase family 39 protein [Bacteroidetes bacterium]|nr:glycosyltransferase family 39 protein [Bacteroidota bacterium]